MSHSSKKEETNKRNGFSLANKVLVIVFLIAALSLARAVANYDSPKINNNVNPEQDAKNALTILSDGSPQAALLDSNEIKEEKVEALESMDYEEIKKMLGVKSDFCVYFEDATGNVMGIGSVKSGIGSSRIQINGNPCNYSGGTK